MYLLFSFIFLNLYGNVFWQENGGNLAFDTKLINNGKYVHKIAPTIYF